MSFPDTIHAGIGIERLGSRSVVYRIALFRGDDEEPCAIGRFVHVYVDRDYAAAGGDSGDDQESPRRSLDDRSRLTI